jgi:hypothetical protein
MTEPTPEKKDDGFVKQRWVVTGKVVTSDNKAGIRFQRIEEDGTLSEELIYGITAAYMKRFRPGIIYEVEYHPETRKAMLAAANWKGTWPNEEERVVWRTQWDIYEAAELLKKREKDTQQRNFLRERLLPLRELYARTNYQGKLVMEVMVLNALRHHPIKDSKKTDDD